MNGDNDVNSSNTSYNPEPNDPYSIFFWSELIPTSVVCGFTFFLGLIGNCLIIFTTFRYRRMKSVTNVFLSSLASSDLLLIIVCIPVKVAKLFSYTWNLGMFTCKTVHYMQNVSAICSVLTLTAISIERYYAILHPMKAKYICTISQAKRVIIVIWSFSFLLGSPTLIAQAHLPVGLNNEYFYCVKNWDWEFIWRLHEIYMLIVICICPFSVMSISYTLICWEVWKVLERRSTMGGNNSVSGIRNPPRCHADGGGDESIEMQQVSSSSCTNSPGTRYGRDDASMVKQVICMLVAVVVLFAICWTPILIDGVLTAYGVLPHLRIGPLRYMNIAFNLMAYFNSCLNPIIYGFMSKSFRDSFILALCCSKDGVRNYGGVGQRSSRYMSRTSYQTKHTSLR